MSEPTRATTAPRKDARVLVVDDDPLSLRAASETLLRNGYEVLSLRDPVQALLEVKDPTLDLVVSDIEMPNLSGLELLKAVKSVQPDVEVILMTGAASLETAIEAVRTGAYDYVTKPFDPRAFCLRVERAVERRALKKQNVALESTLEARRAFAGIIGQSPQMQSVYRLVETVCAAATTTVLVRGESGTGKELVAKAIHFRSPRAKGPFLAVNCSALTETLLDSELFGHEKGAFTGAVGLRRGLFEAASGGTLFLDEIGDISGATQVKLLRALQEGEIRRVGSTSSISVDTRVIAATHVDLEKAKAAGRFREDLYYRLNVVSVTLPSLRERASDVPLLAQHFLAQCSDKLGKKIAGIAPLAMKALVRYGWPGNVRELENAIERALVLTPHAQLELEDLPDPIREGRLTGGEDVALFGLAHLPFAQAKSLMQGAFEKRYLTSVLERSGYRVRVAAEAAGMDRSNFRRMLRENGISAQELAAAASAAPVVDDD
jgi:two-component system response regulator HydG